MSKKGESILIGLGMMPKGKKPMHDEPDADDEGGPPDDDADDYEPNHGVVMAAEDMCRELGIDEEKAPALGKAICEIIDNHLGK